MNNLETTLSTYENALNTAEEVANLFKETENDVDINIESSETEINLIAELEGDVHNFSFQAIDTYRIHIVYVFSFTTSGELNAHTDKTTVTTDAGTEYMDYNETVVTAYANTTAGEVLEQAEAMRELLKDTYTAC